MIKGFIGVVHLPSMPGDPLAPQEATFQETRDFALRDAEALVAGGVDGLIIENFGSSPFQKGDFGSRIPPHQSSTMALIANACVNGFDIPIGVNCLRNDAYTAIGIAAASGAHFIRVNIHTSTYVTDQGVIEGEAATTLRYRRELGSSVEILADVLVKHAAPLVPTTAKLATEDCINRGHANGIIVTGTGTGKPIDPELLREVKEAAGTNPVLLGSGVTPENISSLGPHSDGAIVGSWLKQDGILQAPVCRDRVKQLVEQAKSFWNEPRNKE